jgi:hypothetical protein
LPGWARRPSTIAGPCTEQAGRAADRASYVAAQAEATRLSAEAIHHQEAVYQMKAAQQDTAHETELSRSRCWRCLC